MSLLCSSFIYLESRVLRSCLTLRVLYIGTINGRTRQSIHGNWASLASNDRRSSFFHSTMPFNLDSNATAQLPPPCLCTFRYSEWMQMLHQMSAMKMQIAMETTRSGPGTNSMRRKSPNSCARNGFATSNWLTVRIGSNYYTICSTQDVSSEKKATKPLGNCWFKSIWSYKYCLHFPEGHIKRGVVDQKNKHQWPTNRQENLWNFKSMLMVFTWKITRDPRSNLILPGGKRKPAREIQKALFFRTSDHYLACNTCMVHLNGRR